MMGICPQHDVIFEFLTVTEHLELLAHIKGIPEQDIPAKIQEILTLVDLDTKVRLRQD